MNINSAITQKNYRSGERSCSSGDDYQQFSTYPITSRASALPRMIISPITTSTTHKSATKFEKITSHESPRGSLFPVTPKPLFQNTKSPNTAVAVGKRSPIDPCKRNPRLYSHKKNIDLKAAKKR